MKIGYMTNAFGQLVGDGGGVQSIKDVHYHTLADTEDMLRPISEAGYDNVEIFDGNLHMYEGNEEELKKLLEKYDLTLIGVYTAGFFIYDDVLDEELQRISKTAKLAKSFGAKHMVVGGGSVRLRGIKEGDAAKLGRALDMVSDVIEENGLIASYHPHLGSIAEKPKEIEEVFDNSKINFCPDIAHLVAGGSNVIELLEKYYDRIKYIHLKDLSDSGEFFPLGEGRINLHEVINLFINREFKGDWLVEIDGYPGDPVKACESSLKFLKENFEGYF